MEVAKEATIFFRTVCSGFSAEDPSRAMFKPALLTPVIPLPQTLSSGLLPQAYNRVYSLVSLDEDAKEASDTAITSCVGDLKGNQRAALQMKIIERAEQLVERALGEDFDLSAWLAKSSSSSSASMGGGPATLALSLLAPDTLLSLLRGEAPATELHTLSLGDRLSLLEQGAGHQSFRTGPFLTVLDWAIADIHYSCSAFRGGPYGLNGAVVAKGASARPREFPFGDRQETEDDDDEDDDEDSYAKTREARAEMLLELSKALAESNNPKIVGAVVHQGGLDALCRQALAAGTGKMGLQYVTHAFNLLTKAITAEATTSRLALQSPYVRRLLGVMLSTKIAKLLIQKPGSLIHSSWTVRPPQAALRHLSTALFEMASSVLPRPSMNAQAPPSSSSSSSSSSSYQGAAGAGSKRKRAEDSGADGGPKAKRQATEHGATDGALPFLLAMAGIFPADELKPGAEGEAACEKRALEVLKAHQQAHLHNFTGTFSNKLSKKATGGGRVKKAASAREAPNGLQIDLVGEDLKEPNAVSVGSYAFTLELCEKAGVGICKPKEVELKTGHIAFKGSAAAVSPVPLVALAELERAEIKATAGSSDPVLWREHTSRSDKAGDAAAAGAKPKVKMTPLAPLLYTLLSASSDLCDHDSDIRGWLSAVKGKAMINSARASIILPSSVPQEYDLSAFGGPKDLPLLKDEEPEAKECIVCFKPIPEGPPTAFIPCLHANCCQDCATNLANKGKKECPTCCKKITGVGKVFF
jgi:Zinc finger, C3HC4 type (RING finger)